MVSKTTRNEITKIIKQMNKITSEAFDRSRSKEIKTLCYKDKEAVPSIVHRPLILIKNRLCIRTSLNLDRVMILDILSSSNIKNVKYELKRKMLKHTIKKVC